MPLKIAKKKTKAQAPPTELDIPRESLVLGHLIKYNLYLLTKAVIFAAMLPHSVDKDDAVTETNRIIDELDLQSKQNKQ